mgnify:FL=1
MTSEVAILRAYALATQGRYAEAENLLKSADGALNTTAGADLLARIRFEQGDVESAKHIWEQVLSVEPTNESALKALNAANTTMDDESVCDDLEECYCRRFRFVCAAVIAVLMGLAFSVGKMCGGGGRPEASQESDSPVVIAEQSIPVRAINGAILRTLKDGILTNMTDSTTLVLLGGTGKYITDRQKRLSIIAECIKMEAKVPLSQILFQASDQETNSITLSVRQYKQPNGKGVIDEQQPK